MDAKKILMVEDDPDFANMLGVRLARAGYITCHAKDGEEALGKLEIEKPDLVLLDIIMPKMNGYTFIKEMRKKYSTPVIVLTAKEKMKDLFKMEDIKDYIVKPFDDDDLLLRIKRALEK